MEKGFVKPTERELQNLRPFCECDACTGSVGCLWASVRGVPSGPCLWTDHFTDALVTKAREAAILSESIQRTDMRWEEMEKYCQCAVCTAGWYDLGLRWCTPRRVVGCMKTRRPDNRIKVASVRRYLEATNQKSQS